MRHVKLLALLTVAALMLAACDGEEATGPPGAAGSPTASPTASPTGGPGPGSPSPTASPAPGDAGVVEGDQTYIVAPQEPLTLPPAEPGDPAGRGVAEFTAVGTYEQGVLPETLDLSVLPCGNVEFGGGVRIRDADGDGAADDLGRTDTDRASVVLVNGQPVEWEGPVLADLQVGKGTLSFALRSEGEDCAVPVVFTDRDGDAALDTGPGEVTEPFGVAQVTWRAP